MKLPKPPLLLITDRKQARAALEDVLEQALAAGCRWASLREKDLPRDEQLALAQRLLPIARSHNATLTLHGDPQLARDAGLDGVHLSAGADTAAARQTLGPGALIGISIHSVEEARALDPALVDYCVAGPAYKTASKPEYGPHLGMGGIADIVAATSVPVIAIGGISAEVIPELGTAGAAGVAVMGGIMRAADVPGEIRSLVDALR